MFSENEEQVFPRSSAVKESIHPPCRLRDVAGPEYTLEWPPG